MPVSLQTILASIKNLQIIVHLSLINVIVPANTQIFFEMLFTIVAFDPIDVEAQIEQVFSLKANIEDKIDQSFAQLGYESAYLVANMGSLLIFILLEFLLQIIYAITWKAKCCPTRLRSCSHKRLGKFFFNGLLAFIDGTLLVL